MALPSDEIKEEGKKGKAVFVLHTWKDSLWELGNGGDVPEARDVVERETEEGEGDPRQDAQDAGPSGGTGGIVLAEDEASTEASRSTHSPQGKHALEFWQTFNAVYHTSQK
jgi:translation initiation factor 2D